MKNTWAWTAFVRLFFDFLEFPPIIRQSLKKARGTVRSGGPTTAVKDRPDDGREINTCTRRPFLAYRNRGTGGTPFHYRVIWPKTDSAADRLLSEIRKSRRQADEENPEVAVCGPQPDVSSCPQNIIPFTTTDTWSAGRWRFCFY